GLRIGPGAHGGAEAEPDAGPDERVSTEQHRDRRISRRCREGAKPRIADLVGQQQIGSETVLRPRPTALVRPEAVCEQDPSVDHRRVAELGQDRSERLWPAPAENHAERRSGWALPAQAP